MTFLKFITINLSFTTKNYELMSVNLDTIISENKKVENLEKEIESVLHEYKLIK